MVRTVLSTNERASNTESESPTGPLMETANRKDLRGIGVYQIEATNGCNLSCSFCPRQTPVLQRAEGFLSIGLLDRVDWKATTYTELQLSGEPLLHPALLPIIQYLHDVGVKVGLSTNLTVWRKQRAVLDELDVLTINDDEFRSVDPEFIAEYEGKTFVQTIGENLPFDDYSRREKYPVPKCITPERYVSIQWDGDVVPCCKAHGKEVVFGNLYREDWGDIMAGETRAKFLGRLRRQEGNGLCEYCLNPNPHQIHERLKEMMSW